MKEQVKTVFTCDFCKKKLFTRHSMKSHEDFCNSNPKNFAACSGCVYIEEVPKEYFVHEDGEWYDPTCKHTNGFRCKKLDKGLYPFKCVKKGMLDKYPEQFVGEEQMPVTCEHRINDLPW